MQKHKFKRLLAVAALVLVLFLFIGAEASPAVDRWLQSEQPGLYSVLSVEDGDTITVDSLGHVERVRLIGIDTPELHHPDKPVQCYATEAKIFLENLINIQQVRLEADPEDDNRDIYGRLLRYVYLPDGTLINAEIVRSGYGFAYTFFPFTKKDLMLQLETEAKNEHRGLWDMCQIINGEFSKETNPI